MVVWAVVMGWLLLIPCAALLCLIGAVVTLVNPLELWCELVEAIDLDEYWNWTNIKKVWSQ